MNKKGITQLINWKVLLLSGITLLLFIAVGFFFPNEFSEGANQALIFVIDNFSWFITPISFIMIIFCIWAGFSKYGKIKLGGPDAIPKMSKPIWFAIALTSGIAVGINYYGVYEPINFAYNPPEFLHIGVFSPDTMLAALKYTFLHWCIHPYSIYTTAGLCIAFLVYNSKQRYRVCTSLYPLFGEKMYGICGDLIDSISIFAIIGGIATSLGFATLQIGRGLNLIFGISSNIVLWGIIIIVMTFFYTSSSISGLHKGIKYVSNINTILYFVILLFVFIVIDPVGILELTISSIGSYLNDFIDLSLFLDPIEKTGWIGMNNVFFYTWWMVFAPIIGLFLVKLAYGRTIKEFVVVNLVAPVVFSFIWFGVFGGGSLILEKFYSTDIGMLINQNGSDMALYALLQQLPLTNITSVIALIIVILSFVTLAESMTISISAMSLNKFYDMNGEAETPKIINIFWGIIMALAAFVLLVSGGTEALQTASIVCGLPIAVIILFMMISYIKTMKNLERYDLYSKGDLYIYNMGKD